MNAKCVPMTSAYQIKSGSSKVELCVLGEENDAELHELSRACPIEADFSFYFDRSPDFFAWPKLVFESFKYFGIRVGGRLVGCVGAGISRGWLGSKTGRFAYFRDARVLPEHRGNNLIANVTMALSDHLRSDYEAAYLLVKHGNQSAQRAAQKFYPDQIDIRVLGAFDAVNLLLLRRVRPPGTCEVRTAREQDLSELSGLLAGEYQSRPFAPLVTDDSLARECRKVPGLGLERTYVARRGGEIVGTLTAWDQSELRRTILLRYSRKGKLIRLGYQLGRLLYRKAASLPRIGEAFRAISVTRLAVRNRDPEVLRDLLAAVVNDHVGLGYHLVSMGLMANDPLNPATKEFSVQRFRSDLLIAGDREQRPVLDDICDHNDPYVDLAMV